jgi:Cu-Zn family superoxide dismutase
MPRHTIALAALLCLACAGESADTDATAADTTAMPDMGAPQPAAGATAAMRDAQGNDLGTLTLSDAAGGISIAGHLMNLPEGEHGIHVHMTGACEPPFESAGGHWNPSNAQHGLENPQGPHYGDMPNLMVPAGGMVDVQLQTAGGTLAELLDADGAAVVIHSGADDQTTDPSGDSGDRIACGVVQRG